MGDLNGGVRQRDRHVLGNGPACHAAETDGGTAGFLTAQEIAHGAALEIGQFATKAP